MRLRSVALLLSALSFAASAQTFDAVSIHPNDSGKAGGSIVGYGGSTGRVTFDNQSLRDCIELAYGIPPGREYELSGPGWLDSDMFDIAATFRPGTARSVILTMTQRMLADRFGLRVHYETKELQAYALTVMKDGPKLKPHTSAEEGYFYSEDHVTFRAVDMAGLSSRLSGAFFHLDRPVVDHTELKGAYDFTLNWSAKDPTGASLFTAIQEQLGLRLAIERLPFRILIVDNVNREPTPN
ncbi:MAG TPA: TIGR03435 family protein [Bryobacteraceae bacterium]|nr:TIGR03435 family protein [Bryobacteraceae bacterium]